jgi:hypothetical protein
MESAKICLTVLELANARATLEGKDETFAEFAFGETSCEEGLSVRQMALLSGMEEMSIRAAANPKRANRLEPMPTSSGRTLFALNVAKAWLQSKGRYIPVTHYFESSDLDLSRTIFKDVDDMAWPLSFRLMAIMSKRGREMVMEQLKSAGIKTNHNIPHDIELIFLKVLIDDEAKLSTLAEILELPADLLLLRCQEAAAHTRLAEIEYEIKHLNNK